MKISKLFHWLYAVVMLLPIFAIGVTCCYVVFNKNAKDSYYGTLTNNETYINTDLSTFNNNEWYYFNTQNYSNTNSSFDIYCEEFILEDYGTLSQTAVTYFQNSQKVRIYCRINNTPEFYKINNDNSYTWITNSGNFICKFKIAVISNNLHTANGFYTIQYNELTYISEVFYYSIDKVQQSPLFNWAYNSFLVTPFSYIVALFSMPTNSFIVMLLSYWLAISIIWLVFDLIMYVPLLTHRWIDKGIIE